MLMNGWRTAHARAVLSALDQSLATIEFDLKGVVVSANANFCKVMGYDLSEIRGRHHSMFVDPSIVRSPDYAAFWDKLARGEYEAREYRRIGKGGRAVWLQASYNPMRNARGSVVGIVKQATDITSEKRRTADAAGKLDAIGRVQAVIEFTVDGQILDANDNFLTTLGYRLDEVKDRHHRIFVAPAYAGSPDYAEFWAKLRRGEFIVAEFLRIGKGGREVWIQASYNPVFDPDGKVAKVVKFATDVTERVRAVNAIGKALARLADNDLDCRIDVTFASAFEPLRHNFNESIATIGETLVGINARSQSIEAGTREISIAAEDLSRRTEQQAASLEETAAALDEITATVRKTAEGSKHTRGVVGTAKRNAEASGLVVSQAVDAMNSIEASSREITQIIGVIDEIAFQTNLLALNAGVEAARAGDAGRGFAVVASEVRALAQRSADAAKEIKRLISTSSQQVDNGVALVGRAGQALTLIATQVTEIDVVVGEIAASAQEQATALDEVNTAVNQMDQVTQQNAAMVEETTAASQSLAHETQELARLIGQFRLADQEPDEVAEAISRRARSPSIRPVKPLRIVGRGGAMRKPSAGPAPDADWEEF
jgi:methyl-accepting chemotaxis protein